MKEADKRLKAFDSMVTTGFLENVKNNTTIESLSDIQEPLQEDFQRQVQNLHNSDFVKGEVDGMPEESEVEVVREIVTHFDNNLSLQEDIEDGESFSVDND